MKALPLVTLAICVGFLVLQQTSVSSTAKSNTSLQTRITQAESSLTAGAGESAGRPSVATKASRRTTGSGRKPPALANAQTLSEIDLEELVEAMQKAESGGVPDFKAMIRIRSLLLEATPKEISDLIARTAALEIPDQVKQGLIGQFVQALAEQDPHSALELAIQSPHLDIDKQRWHFSHSFSKWVIKEPAAAVAWFDRELAKGTFNSKSLSGESDARREFEAAAIGALARTDAAQARERLLALPEEQRLNILNQGHRFRLDEEGAPAYAQLVRESLPEEKRADAFASAAQHVVQQNGYQGVTEFADTIEASTSERAALVRQAAVRQFERMNWEGRTPKAEDVTELRSFLQAEAPDTANAITGEALGKSANSTETFEVAAGLLRDLHATNPDDQLLVGFLESPRILRTYQEGARQLAQEISDPAQRQAILEKIK